MDCFNNAWMCARTLSSDQLAQWIISKGVQPRISSVLPFHLANSPGWPYPYFADQLQSFNRSPVPQLSNPLGRLPNQARAPAVTRQTDPSNYTGPICLLKCWPMTPLLTYISPLQEFRIGYQNYLVPMNPSWDVFCQTASIQPSEWRTHSYVYTSTSNVTLSAIIYHVVVFRCLYFNHFKSWKSAGNHLLFKVDNFSGQVILSYPSERVELESVLKVSWTDKIFRSLPRVIRGDLIRYLLLKKYLSCR